MNAGPSRLRLRALGGSARAMARPVVERTTGLLPLLEARNRVTRSRASRSVLRLEDFEVARQTPANATGDGFKAVTIIATYRRPHLLRSAVESALAQTEEDHMVVVVSDGDDEPDLSPHERLRVIALSRHIGVLGAVRNIGIRISRSRYLAFLDDDNRWLPHHLSDCIEVLDRGKHFVYSGVVRVLPDGSRYDELKIPFSRRRLRNESFIDANAMVVRRTPQTLFSRIPRPRGVLPPEDWEFAWRLTKAGASLVERPSVEYLINPDSHFYPHFYEYVSQEAGRSSPGNVPDSQ